MKHFYKTLTVVAILISSCQKVDVFPKGSHDPGNTYSDTLTKTRLICETKEFLLTGLCSKSYNYEKQFVNGQDITAFVPICDLDNIITLSRNGDYVETEGKITCKPGDPQVHNKGKFQFLCATNKISIVTPDLTTILDIIELTPNRIKVKFFDPLQNAEIEFWLKYKYENI